MKRIDTSRIDFQIKEDDAVVSLLNREIYVEILHSYTKEVLKSYVYNWTGSETGDTLIVDTVTDIATVFVTGDEVDAADEGKYDLHVWYIAADTDFPDDERRRHAYLCKEITILDDQQDC